MAGEISHSTRNWVFWFHLLITLLAWLGPFLISWQVMISAYGLVILQFMVFKRCLLNAKHDLDTSSDTTFYSHLLESVGIHLDRSTIKKFVRRYLYLILALVTFLWQVLWEHEAILF